MTQMDAGQGRMDVIEISNLSVEVGGSEILHDVNITIKENETFALFGPNGSGKSTLMNVILGMPQYKVKRGFIKFRGKDVTKLSVTERVRLGIGVSFQLPPEIKGVTLRDMLNICLGKKPGSELSEKTLSLVRTFKLEAFLERNINVDFSGGEKKRADLLQVLLLKPRFLMLDEPDSGVDIVSLKMISEEIYKYIKASKASAMIVTHQGEVLNHIKAQRACILFDGRNYCFHSPQKILADIRKNGYEGCVSCRIN
jgi:Fe-S cluster assembly ATP-binding protein